MESEIWSAILSGCPSVTDSEVNEKFLLFNSYLLFGMKNEEGRMKIEKTKDKETIFCFYNLQSSIVNIQSKGILHSSLVIPFTLHRLSHYLVVFSSG